MTDGQLLAEYADRKSEEAFALLVERYSALVYASCRRELGEGSLAEDATQAVFIVLAKKADRLKGEPVLSDWLFRTARYVAANARRKEARRARHERAASREAAASEASSAESDPAWAEIRPQVDRAIFELPAASRRALVLHYLEGRSQKETARALGITESAAQMRIGYAVEKLKQRLARQTGCPSVALLAALLKANASAAVPAGLAASIRAAVAAETAGTGAAGAAAEMAKGAMDMMVMEKVKCAAALLLAVVLVGGGAPLALYAGAAKKDEAPRQTRAVNGAAKAPAAEPQEKAAAGPALATDVPLPGPAGLILTDVKGNRLFVEAGNSLLEVDLKSWKAKETANVLCAAPYGAGMVMGGKAIPTLSGGVHPDACRVYQREAPEGDMLVLRTADFQVAGYRKGSGTPAWRYQAAGGGSGPGGFNVTLDGFPIADKKVYGTTEDGRFFALDAATGRELWTIPLGTPGGKTVAVLGPNGKVEQKTEQSLSRVCQPPVVVAGLAYLANGDGLIAVDLQEKQMKWQFQHDTFRRAKGGAEGSKATVSDGMVYFSTNHHENIVYGIDIATGNEVWRFGKPGAMEIMTPPVVGEKAVFVATDAMGPSTCYALDRKTGKTIWEQKLPGIVWHAPVLEGGVLYLACDRKIILGLAEGDGKIACEYRPPLIEPGASAKDAPKPRFLTRIPEKGERLEHMAVVPGYLLVTTALGGQEPSKQAQFSMSFSARDRGPNTEHRLLVMKLPAAK